MNASAASPNPLTTLRRFAARSEPKERCELCAAKISGQHQHLIEPANRKLICCCDACAVLFSGDTAARYRRVPRRIEFLLDFRMTDVEWENLHLPINLAFFYSSSVAKRVIAMFPSPAGATESLLTLDAWADLASANPVLNELVADVEALLVNRTGPQGEYWRVPIDECFKLVGIIRTHWRGLSGGTEVWKEFAQFSASLRARSVTGGATHA